jgi:FKBP-type peptidyl-prolyl cis-trans isomerase
MKSKNSIFLILFCLAGCLDVSDPTNDQLNLEISAIGDYLKGVTFKHVTEGTNSGIRIGITNFGTGTPPHEGETVKFTYTGRLLSNWSVFETNTFEGKLETIPVNGLRYCIESVLEGTTATFFIPSNYGFGPSGSAKVPGNTTIVYEVVLEKVTKTALAISQFKADTTTIHKYLKDRIIAATLHPSGIWYKIENPGTGKSAHIYNIISFHYKGTIISTESVFQEGDISRQMIFGLIDGLKIGVPLLKEGGSATYYIPSGLAYGSVASTTIPANSNLIFEVKLSSIE